jgi:hypothetical protein
MIYYDMCVVAGGGGEVLAARSSAGNLGTEISPENDDMYPTCKFRHTFQVIQS